MLLWLGEFVASGCFCFCAEGGGRVSARRPRYFFFASPKKSTQKKGDPAARVPLARWARGQPAMLGPGVHRGTRCVPPAGELRSNNRGESDNDARVLRHALTPGPALLGTVRRGWERAPYGPLLRSACGPSLRSARQGDSAPTVGSAQCEPTSGAAAQQQPFLTPPPPLLAAPRSAGAGVGACAAGHTHFVV